MITIQLVRVRWGSAGRGAPQADARRGLSRPVPLPHDLPTGEVGLHHVLFDESDGYARQEVVRGGGLELAGDAGLELAMEGSALRVLTTPLPRAAFPRRRRTSHLFTLAAGETGLYRANFRFVYATCGCNPSSYYEDWVVRVGTGEPDRVVDHRVHLYGGRPVSRQARLRRARSTSAKP